LYDRNGDGSRYEGFFNSFLAPLKAADGTVEGFVASTLEVTEHVQQRERIQTLRHEAEVARAELEQAHAQLEARITARTLELAQANTALAAEIEASGRAEATRRELLRRLATAREDEQRRTARDLHDQVGQRLTALMLAIYGACAGDTLTAHSAGRLRDALRLAEDLGRDVHELASRLRPALLDDLGLHAAFRQLFTDCARQFDLQIDFQATWLERERLPSEVETVLYRVVQEALTNVARHAQAQRVSVVVERHEGHAIAVVEDEGIGFDPIHAGVGRLGLVGMRERVMLAGGLLEIESEPQRGTTVIARVPIANHCASVERLRSDEPEK
jgi:signal transduction histidine kinase